MDVGIGVKCLSHARLASPKRSRGYTTWALSTDVFFAVILQSKNPCGQDSPVPSFETWSKPWNGQHACCCLPRHFCHCCTQAAASEYSSGTTNSHQPIKHTCNGSTKKARPRNWTTKLTSSDKCIFLLSRACPTRDFAQQSSKTSLGPKPKASLFVFASHLAQPQCLGRLLL